MSRLWGKRTQTVLGPEDMDRPPLASMKIAVTHPETNKIYKLDTELSIIKVATPRKIIDMNQSMWDSIDDKTPWNSENISNGIYFMIGCTGVKNKDDFDGLKNTTTNVILSHPNGNITTEAYITDTKSTDVSIIVNDSLISQIEADGHIFKVNKLEDLTKFSWR